MKDLFIVVTILACAVLTGCTGYALRGKVVPGSMSVVTFVDPTDSRLAASEKGISSAKIAIYRDPHTAGSALAGTAVAGPDGTFTLPISNFGAGWMDEQWLIEVARSGFGNATEIVQLPLPTQHMQLLILLAPGVETRQRSEEDAMKLYDKFR